MSYARWFDSAWYAFHNTNGCLSLYYSLDHIIDIPLSKALTITKKDILEMYGCTKKEANEAIKYVKCYIKDSTKAKKRKEK